MSSHLFSNNCGAFIDSFGYRVFQVFAHVFMSKLWIDYQVWMSSAACGIRSHEMKKIVVEL